MDTLDRLLSQEIEYRVREQTPRLTYGVWIHGTGWLRSTDGDMFLDYNKEVAQTAAHLWGNGASVMVADGSLAILERKFIAQQEKQWGKRIWSKLGTVINRLVAFARVTGQAQGL